MKLKNIHHFICFTFLLYSVNLYTQELEVNKFLKYIDSSKNNIDNSPSLANTFLDSIPTPLEKNIKGKIAEYYHLKAIISSHLNNDSEVYYYNMLSLKYAKKEKNYSVAGFANIELFYNFFIIKKDSIALDYLKNAEKYYTLDNNEHGLIDVMQMKAFIHFYNKNYTKCIDLIMPKLAYYKSIKDDSFYYMYALFMLTSSHIHLDNDALHKKYYKEFKKLENDSTISTLLFKIHDVTLNVCMTHLYLDQKKLDSTFYYLKKVDGMRKYMNNEDKKIHFKNYISYYNELKNIDAKIDYTDSLKLHNENLIAKNVNASFKINENFLETSENLELETKKKLFNRSWVLFLATALIAIIVFIILKYFNIRNLIRDFSKQKKEHFYLQKNHEKLKLKIIGLENYLTELKKEIKTISTITNINEQKARIKEIHKEIQLNSSILLAKGEDHLDLINNLNVPFFNKISNKHPQLNSSEIVLCYYLFMGFKNKEIAVFINTSVRSVESKRYRITKKLNINTKDFNLLNYLKETFK